MKVIHANTITKAVKKSCMNANYHLNDDVLKALKKGYSNEESEIGKEILDRMIHNAKIASDEKMAICQDTGMTVVFVEIGQEVMIEGGNLTDAINEGVRQGYKEGYLRCSVVEDPIERINTGDNTPAVIYYDIVGGDAMHVVVMPKGFGSENMSAIKMLKPSDGIEGVKQFILETVEKAGPNPCPPMVIGVGIGGTMEKAALLSKKALARPIDCRNKKKSVEELEEALLHSINTLGIGPSGLGGRTTALAVNVEVYATHIAGLPVAVNISCHATRHAEFSL